MADAGTYLGHQPSWRNPVLGSIVLHTLVFAALGFSGWWVTQRRPDFGTGTQGGGSVMVTPSTLPLPSRQAKPNPVADNTETLAPTPKVREKAVEREDPNAIAIDQRKKKLQEREREQPKVSKYCVDCDQPSQVYSRSGTAVSSPMYGVPGTGGVGFGVGNPFGNRFGAYVTLIQRIIGNKWRTQDIPAQIKTAPPVTMYFEILRDGTVRNVRVLQSSGIQPLDLSAVRALTEASPLPPLPAGFERESATVQFNFQLQR